VLIKPSSPVTQAYLERDYDNLFQLWLPDGSRLFLEEKPITHFLPVAGLRKQYWLQFSTGLFVAFMEAVSYEREKDSFILSAIEVRPSHRGLGLARELVRIVEELEGTELHTTGGFTPEGIRALAFLPLIEGYWPTECFPTMDFVEDWEELESKSAF
jgi:GNAT superfamily N-acetyltransferase